MSKKILILIIFALLIVIAGFTGYIIGNQKKNSVNNDDKTVAVSDSQDSEEGTASEASDEKSDESLSDAGDKTQDDKTSEDKASDDKTSEDNTSDDKKSDASDSDKKDSNKSDISDNKKYACYATIASSNNWKDGDYYVFQYDVKIINKSKSDLDNWEVRISGFKGGKMENGWNAEYNIKNDTMYCKAVDYNKTLVSGSTTELGFQAKFKKEEDGLSEKLASVYIDGKLYTEIKEEPTTQSKADKEDMKKEKTEPEKGTPLENHGALSIKGTDIVDNKGNKYQLKGISTHGLAWFPDYVNKDSFKTLRDDWGANLIRLAMYTAESGGYCQDGDKSKLKNLVCEGVDIATDLGMYVIVDWHILSDNNPSINEDEAITFFDEMSAKYADYDNVLYEICNEPNGSTTWEDIKEYAEKIIPVIRSNDKDAIIIVGTPTWSQDVDKAAENPISGQENIAYTTHFYAATHKDNIRDKVKEAHESGLCVFISEFSICDASGNGGIDYDSAEDWFNMIDEYNLSYAGWNLSNKDETSALLDTNTKSLSDWKDDELSETGLWLKNQIQND